MATDKILNEYPNEKIKSIIGYLSNLTPNEFTLVGMSLGFVLGQDISTNEQQSFGNFLILVGQVLLTLQSQAFTVKGVNNPIIRKDDLEKAINDLIKILKD